jgi:hypothetical protein
MLHAVVNEKLKTARTSLDRNKSSAIKLPNECQDDLIIYTVGVLVLIVRVYHY